MAISYRLSVLAEALRFHFSARRRHKCVERLRPKIAARTASHGHCAFGGFAIAYDEHVGNLLKLRLTDLISNLLLALVDLHPESRSEEPRSGAVGVRYMPVGDRQHNRLHRREPQRKRTGIVLNEDRDEPLEAAE